MELNPIQWAIRPLTRYADFDGRASRAEYWWYALAAAIVGFGLACLDKVIGGPIIGLYGPLSVIFTVGTLVPGLAVIVRRLHDIDRTGWWVLLDLWSYIFVAAGFAQISIESAIKSMSGVAVFVLIVLMLICTTTMLVFAVTRGTEGWNRYGPDPYGRDQLEEVFA